MPPSTTTTIVPWAIQTATLGPLKFPAARLSFKIFARTAAPGLQYSSVACWLDTGAPLSVVPFNVHHQQLLWRPVPGTSTSWKGQPCTLGYLDIWLPTDQPPYLRGPLPLLAKFASDPPGSPVPVLLGLEFFLAHQAEFELRPPPREGSVVLP